MFIWELKIEDGCYPAFSIFSTSTFYLRKERLNNFSNISKTNNDLSPQTNEHKKIRHMALEIQTVASDRYKNVAELNRLMRPLPLIIVSPTITRIIMELFPLLVIGV